MKNLGLLLLLISLAYGKIASAQSYYEQGFAAHMAPRNYEERNESSPESDREYVLQNGSPRKPKLTNYTLQIKPLFRGDVENQLAKIAGTADNWTRGWYSGWLEYVRKLPFMAQRLQNNNYSVLQSMLNTSDPKGVLRAFAYARNSQDPSIRQITISLESERLFLVKSYTKTTDRLKSSLYFLRRLKDGDTDYEKEKFAHMARAFKSFADRFNNAIKVAEISDSNSLPTKGLPILLEFQSSTMSADTSPIMFAIYQMVEEDFYGRVFPTPNRGRIVKIDVAYAKVLSTMLTEISSDISAKVAKFSSLKDPSTEEYKTARSELIKIFSKRSGIVSHVERTQTMSIINYYRRAVTPENATIASSAPYGGNGNNPSSSNEPVTCEGLFGKR